MSTETTLTREEQLDEIKRILRLPKADRWREARDFTLKVNPVLRREDELFQRQIAVIREQQNNDYATSDGGTLRYALSIPTSMVEAIRQFDPEFLSPDKRAYKNKNGSNRVARKLMRIFPEYRIPRKI